MHQPVIVMLALLFLAACRSTPGTLVPATFDDPCPGVWVLEFRNNTATTLDVSWVSSSAPTTLKRLGKASIGVNRFVVPGRGRPHYAISTETDREAVAYRILCRVSATVGRLTRA